VRDLLTDALDVLALLLLAAGAGSAVLSWRIGLAVAVAGVVLVAGSQFVAWQARPESPNAGSGTKT
jgi:hypothetical protein